MLPVDELKEYIIGYLHEKRVSEYKDRYMKNNDGAMPDKQSVNTFVAMLIAQGNMETQAKKMAEDFVKKVQKPAGRKNILVNTTFTIPALSTVGLLIYILSIKRYPDFLITGIAYYTALSVALLVGASIIIATVLHIRKPA